MILGYRSPFAILQLLNNLIAVIWIGRFDCLFTYGGKIEVGNEPRRFLRVRPKEDVTNANVPMIDPKPIEGSKTLEIGEYLVNCG